MGGANSNHNENYELKNYIYLKGDDRVEDPTHIYDINNKSVILTCDILQDEVIRALKSIQWADNQYDVISVKRICPLDSEFIELLCKYDTIYTVEEHNINGGFGSLISELVVERDTHPKVVRIGTGSSYYKADLPRLIRRKAGLDAEGLGRIFVRDIR